MLSTAAGRQQQLETKHLHRTFAEIEMPLTLVLAQMEYDGVGYLESHRAVLMQLIACKVDSLLSFFNLFICVSFVLCELTFCVPHSISLSLSLRLSLTLSHSVSVWVRVVCGIRCQPLSGEQQP